MLKVLRKWLGYDQTSSAVIITLPTATDDLTVLEQKLLATMQTRSVLDDNIREMRSFADRLNKFYTETPRRDSRAR